MDLRTRARLLAVAAAVLFSTGGAAIKITQLTAWQVAGLRSLVAGAAVFLLLPASRRLTLRVLPVAAAYAAMMVLFVAANKLATAASAIFLQSTAPLHILLLSPWLLGERARARDAAYMAVLGAGLVLCVLGAGPPTATAPAPGLGSLLAACAGLAWALTVMGLRWLGREEGGGRSAALSSVAWGNVLACLVCLPWALPLDSATAADGLVVLYLGLFQVGLAYVCLTAAVRRLPALEVSLLLLLEPGLSPLWAWAVHAERPTLLVLAGGAVVLAASAARAVDEAGTARRLRRA